MIYSRRTIASSVGLLLAWGGTALLVSPATTFLGDSQSAAVNYFGQIALWLLFAAILEIVVFWEEQPLTSLWLKKVQWQSVAWGGILVLANQIFFFPITEWPRRALGFPGYEMGMERVLVFPLWFRAVSVITAGIVEETLFRGYTVTRLAQLFGSMWLAAGLSVAAFAALHIPVWGLGPSFAFLVSGALMKGFFIWKRDLLAMILAHIAIDAWAPLVTPHFFEWWQ